MEAQEKILKTALTQFFKYGIRHVTMDEIARELGMSPANIYRFFDSKRSINAGVARRLMGQVERQSQTIATGKQKAATRLRELLTTVHRMNSERYVGDSKMHEMVAVAMEEDWEVCKNHMECIVGIIGTVIADGVASGEFQVSDIPLAAHCTCTAMVRFFHPQVIAQCADKPGPTIDQMIDFVIAGLQHGGGQKRA